MGDDVIVTSFKFSLNNCPYLKNLLNLQTSYLEPIHNNVHLMIKMKVTLMDNESHRRRSNSKFTKNEDQRKKFDCLGFHGPKKLGSVGFFFFIPLYIFLQSISH